MVIIPTPIQPFFPSTHLNKTSAIRLAEVVKALGKRPNIVLSNDAPICLSVDGIRAVARELHESTIDLNEFIWFD